MRHRTLLAAAGLACVGLVARALQSRPDGDDDLRTTRAFELRSIRPSLGDEETRQLLDQSDGVVEGLNAQGVLDIPVELRQRLAQSAPTEAERQEYFAANAHIFGGRSYAESMWTVDQLLRIQRVRDELGIERSTPYQGAAPVPIALAGSTDLPR